MATDDRRAFSEEPGRLRALAVMTDGGRRVLDGAGLLREVEVDER